MRNYHNKPPLSYYRTALPGVDYSELQGKLIAATAQLLNPGGTLVYAVCSLEPEEGPGVVAEALRNGWRRQPMLANEIPTEFITADGHMRTLPSHWPEIGGLDGFYAARLQRT